METREAYRDEIKFPRKARSFDTYGKSIEAKK